MRLVLLPLAVIAALLPREADACSPAITCPSLVPRGTVPANVQGLTYFCGELDRYCRAPRVVDAEGNDVELEILSDQLSHTLTAPEGFAPNTTLTFLSEGDEVCPPEAFTVTFAEPAPPVTAAGRIELVDTSLEELDLPSSSGRCTSRVLASTAQFRLVPDPSLACASTSGAPWLSLLAWAALRVRARRPAAVHR